MNYEEIDKTLSSVSFDSKMTFAFSASIKTMSVNGQVESEELQKIFLPDEIETFVLNSIVSKEYKNNEMTEIQFIEVMNAIRKYQPPKYYQKPKTDYLKWVLPTIGSVQFESQQYSIFRLYRHHCLFSFSNENVDVDKEFIVKFDKTFDEYAALVYVFQILLSEHEMSIFFDFWKKVNSKAKWFLCNLKITREEYKEELSQFAKNPEDFRYCLRPSYSYPFIEYNGALYLPTPHLLIQSITSAMMNRLTFGNNNLREKIGKNACEDYLFRIVTESKLFDEIHQEYEYEKGKRTIDLMIRKGTIALLVESKLFSPKVSLRTYDEEAYRSDSVRMTKEIKQAYRHARFKFNKEYFPFSEKIDDVYALVVVYQEGYLEFQDIYTEIAEELSYNKDSEEYIWLCHHVGYTDIATFERFMLTQTDVIPEIVNRDASANQWLIGQNGANLTHDVLDYKEKLMNNTEDFFRSMYENTMG